MKKAKPAKGKEERLLGSATRCDSGHISSEPCKGQPYFEIRWTGNHDESVRKYCIEAATDYMNNVKADNQRPKRLRAKKTEKILRAGQRVCGNCGGLAKKEGTIFRCSECGAWKAIAVG